MTKHTGANLHKSCYSIGELRCGWWSLDERRSGRWSGERRQLCGSFNEIGVQHGHRHPHKHPLTKPQNVEQQTRVASGGPHQNELLIGPSADFRRLLRGPKHNIGRSTASNFLDEKNPSDAAQDENIRPLDPPNLPPIFIFKFVYFRVKYKVKSFAYQKFFKGENSMFIAIHSLIQFRV